MALEATVSPIAGGSAPPIAVRSPRDGELIATVPSTPLDELPGIIAKAREAQAGWAALSVKERVRRIRNIRHRWLDKGQELAAVLQKEGGKSEVEALMS